MTFLYRTKADYFAALELDAVNWLLTDESYRHLPVPGASRGLTASDLSPATLALVNA